MEKIVISCLESRVETNRSIYARFVLGPFKEDAITIATALRRSLLSKVKSIAITAIHIQGVTHEFSTIVGVRESVLDLALNFQQVVLRTKSNEQTKRFSARLRPKYKQAELIKQGLETSDLTLQETNKQQKPNKGLFSDGGKTFTYSNAKRTPFFERATELSETVQIGYLQMQGPAIIYANDLKLPTGVECVDPTQYIATLSSEGSLVVKFLIGGEKASFSNSAGVLTGNELLKKTSNKTEPFLSSAKKLLQKNLVSVPPQKADISPYQVQTRTGNAERMQPRTQDQVFLNKNIPRRVSAYQDSVPVEFDHSRSQARSFYHPFQLLYPTTCLRDTIFLDPIFDSVFQVNYIIEKDDLFNQPRERVVLEFWTNGSVHPRQALQTASLSLISTFSIFRKLFQVDSL